MNQVLCLLVLASGALGCQTVATSGDDAPARIVDPTDEGRAALQEAVNAALHIDVLLANDALTNTSLLVIEHRVPKSIEGSPAGGRIMESPFQFRLVVNGDDCVLVDLRDDSRRTLKDTSCVAEE